MKKRFLLVALLTAIIFSAQAADIYYYQTKFTEKVDSFKVGLKNNEAFEKMLVSLDSLQTGLAAEVSIPKKEPLLTDIQAVYAFVGEIAPGPKSYMLDINQKAKALAILGITEEEFPDSTSCMPITKIELWDNYSCYLVTNNSDSMMIKYKYNFLVERKYSSYSGYVEAGVSVKCSRSLFESFNNDVDVVFTQEKCVQEIGIVKYIQPEIIQPKVEQYQQPDYLSPQQKQALKKKMKEKLKKDKEKSKKKAIKDKKKKKKELEKLRKQKKKDQMAAIEAKKQALEDKKQAALKAKKK